MTKMKMLLTLFLCAHLLTCTSADSHDLRDVHFAEGYNVNELPPNVDGKPMKVNVSLNLRNILEVDEKAQFISLETTLRMYWMDQRVKGNPLGGLDFVNVNGKMIDHFWIPDIFIDQAKAVRTPTYHVKPSTLRVYPDGLIRYSSRINYDVACNMDFHGYPVDKQMCEIKFESFGYTASQMEFNWADHSLNNINPNISLEQFNETIIFESSYTTDYYDIKYPGVILRILLERKIQYHLLQTYIPSGLFVIIAWLSMFISPEAIPGRVSMVMMSLLTLMAMFSGVRQNTPKVSYVSYLDVWMLMCIIFIFFVLIEFAFVFNCLRTNQKPKAEKVEQVMVFVIPSLFVVFNFIYWICIFTTTAPVST